jgi:hypothetical protein
MVSPVLLSSVVSAVLSGGISYVVSSRVAEEQVEAQIQLENEQRLREWYEQTIALVQRTHDDWWDVMASGEKDYDVDAKEKFLTRRDELRQHAAQGRGMQADETVVYDLKKAADAIGYAVNDLDSGESLATIEKADLIPTLDSIEDACKEKDLLSDE